MRMHLDGSPNTAGRLPRRHALWEQPRLRPLQLPDVRALPPAADMGARLLAVVSGVAPPPLLPLAVGGPSLIRHAHDCKARVQGGCCGMHSSWSEPSRHSSTERRTQGCPPTGHPSSPRLGHRRADRTRREIVIVIARCRHSLKARCGEV